MKPNVLYSYYPAQWHRNLWREGFVAGNGRTGINVLGAVQHETVLLNRGDLWTGLKKTSLPDVSDALKQMRELRKKGQFLQADRAICDALVQKGYKASCSVPLPLGQLDIVREKGGIFENYLRSLDMDSGEICVRWKSEGNAFERRYFVDAADDRAYIGIRSSIEDSFILRLRTRDERDSQFPCPPYVAESAAVSAENGRVEYSARNDDGLYFGANLCLKTDGKISVSNAEIRVSGATDTLLCVGLYANRERPVQETIKLTKGYETLFARHKKAFKRQYRGTEINLYRGKSHANEELLLQAQKDGLSAELIEKMVRYGRYLFVSGTSAGALPFAQYGLWFGDYSAQWSQNVLNENLELIYEQSFCGNLVERLLPVFDYFESNLEEYREAAKKLFGCRGICIHAYSCPNMGGVAVNVPVITNWTGAAAWIAHFYEKYFEFTQDETFLVSRALPFLKEVCLFYLDFLYLNERGEIEIYPSVSPENSPKNFVGENAETLSHPMPSAINSAMDVALVREVFTQYLSLSARAGQTDENEKKMRQILNRLPAYRTEDGAFKEWCFDGFSENHNHRHFAHLYPLWPGDEIKEESEWFEACRRALERRTENGLHHQSGWSLTHLCNLYCRLHDGERAYECLKFLVKSDVLQNLMTVHNDWRGMGMSLHTGDIAPVQLDANLGFVCAVQEMLLHCEGNRVEILPALPAALRKGRAKNLRMFQYTVSLEWDTQQKTLKISTDCPDLGAYDLRLPKQFSNVRIN